MPQQLNINTDRTNEINYLYDAAGIKLRKQTLIDNAVEKTLDYIGNFVYEDLELRYILSNEGRIMVNSNRNYEYQYFLKDHLGNTRVTFNENEDIIQEDAYYPFGMQMNGLCYETGLDYKNKYLYNGKELQEEFGLDWYDYGARFYDAQLGRWHVVDPKASNFPSLSPYNYVENNPIILLDSDGKEPREGNKVIKVYFERAFITLIRDDDPKFRKYDPHLWSSASDRFAHVTLIGPRGRGPKIQRKFFKYKKYFKMLEGSVFSEQNQAFAWKVSAKSSAGYQYVEFQEQDNYILDIRRDVKNLNEKLGVEGFENVVTRKQTFEVDQEGNKQLINEEFWSYRTTETESGEKKVEYEHMNIDMRPGGEIERSGWKEAEPAKYNPDE